MHLRHVTVIIAKTVMFVRYLHLKCQCKNHTNADRLERGQGVLRARPYWEFYRNLTIHHLPGSSSERSRCWIKMGTSYCASRSILYILLLFSCFLQSLRKCVDKLLYSDENQRWAIAYLYIASIIKIKKRTIIYYIPTRPRWGAAESVYVRT